jgi:hypothetical protein
MAVVHPSNFLQLIDEDGTEDPDDFRPNSGISLVIDPRRDDRPFVDGISLLIERMAVGDRIPLHVHTIDEVIVILGGTGETRLGDERTSVAPGSVIFIPAGVPHGTRNTGDVDLRLQAMFPSTNIPIEYLERNPAPGTEGDPPQPPFTLDVRALMESLPQE